MVVLALALALVLALGLALALALVNAVVGFAAAVVAGIIDLGNVSSSSTILWASESRRETRGSFNLHGRPQLALALKVCKHPAIC